MNATFFIFERSLLLAETPASTQMGNRLQAESANSIWLLLAIGGVLLIGLLIAGWSLKRWFLKRRNNSLNDPRLMLRELCKAHGLSRRVERLILTMARCLGVKHPGRLFLEPRLLSAAIQQPELAHHRKAILLLQARIFDDHHE